MRSTFIAVLIIMFSSTPAFASCFLGPRHIADEFIKSEAVFLGTVSKKYKEEGTGRDRFLFEIEEIFKDETKLLAKEKNIVVAYNKGGGATHMVEGSKKIMYTRYRSEDDLFFYNPCGPSKPSIDSLEDYKNSAIGSINQQPSHDRAVYEGRVIQISHSDTSEKAGLVESEIIFAVEHEGKSKALVVKSWHCGPAYIIREKYFFSTIENFNLTSGHFLDCDLQGPFLVNELERLREFRDKEIVDPIARYDELKGRLSNDN